MSTETAPSPEKAPAKDPLHLEGAPEALQIEMIEKLRAEEMKLENKLVSELDNPLDTEGEEKAREAARAQFDKLIENHLASKGITRENNEKYLEYVALLRSYSVDHIPENIWKDGMRDDDGNETVPPMRKAAYEEVREKYTTPEKKDDEPSKETDPTGDDKEGDKTDDKGDEGEDKDGDKKETGKTDDETEKLVKERLEKIAKLEEELKGVQGAKHAAFAARMAVSYFARGKKKELGEKYEEAERIYTEKLRELEALKAEEQRENEKASQEEINKAIAERFTDRLQKDHKLQKEAMLKEGGFKAKILEKYQNLSRGKKIAVAIGAGALIAAGGAGLGALAGLIGTGVATAAAGGITIGAKSARTYATAYSRIYADKNPDNLKFTIDYPRAHTTEGAIDLALNFMKSESSRDIESADKAKRNAVFMAMGTAATAGILGAGAMDALDAYSNRGAGWVGGVVGNEIAGTPVSATPGTGAVAETWSVKPAAEEVLQYTPEAKVLNAGDGGFNIFQRMDIPQNHWHQMWQEVGPELQNVKMDDGRPFSYLMPNGEWGVRMTPDGKVPDAALKLIAEKHESLFGTTPASVTDATEAVSASAQETAGDVTQPVIDAKEATELKAVLADPNISAADISSHPELFDKLSHVAPNVELHTYMTEGLGVPDRVWTENVEPFIRTQLEIRNPLYTASFYESPEGIRFTGNGTLPPEVMAGLLQSIPSATRNTFELAG
ncbi:MAG TPA: hypothetical protein VFT59_03265 [Candidatus Saccharimonadales bacterium]|nr:hypothetical protein [Candidatus Saccharimonadales bacterium]